MSILFNVWMLPILFILHDFEEIIFMPLWKTRHHQKLETFKKPFFGSVTQGSAFAVGVFEEFIILVFISGFCQITDNSLLYLSFVIAYTAHFIIHYIMCLQFMGYVPGVVTYLLLAMVIAFTNLKIMHLIMPKIQTHLEKYAK